MAVQTTENKTDGRNFYYAQLAHVGEVNAPAPIRWQASKRETPDDMKYCSGVLDMRTLR